ncbi:class II histocompatibility antigen, M beta 1 chain [Varanus komodoensis]|uniref:class II histocompatibility antigen, M beta 1 chain n=1 Tax=Varanus komodoensis TaxID=61221 RepID=UPI001CF767AE|nr:class II histocompatibility antigen, M beta 1 chain [Varanus komodoensis]
MGPSRLACWVLCLALTHLRAGGFVVHMQTDCPLSADGRALWANWTLSFNKVPFVCYDNEDRAFVPCGMGATFPWNYTTVPIAAVLQRAFPPTGQLQRACQEQIQSLWGRSGDRRTPPMARIVPVTPRNTVAPVMLACLVWGFYPQEVGISWLRNGAPVQAGRGTPTLSSNGDWTYQAQLTLPVDPRLGGTYSCRVIHASLPAPLTVDWVVPGLQPEVKAKIGASAAVLGVGIVVLITGLIFWSKRMPEGESSCGGMGSPFVRGGPAPHGLGPGGRKPWGKRAGSGRGLV